MADKVIAEHIRELKVSTTIFEERVNRYRWLLNSVNRGKRYIELVSEATEDDNIYKNEEWRCGYLSCLTDLLDSAVELELGED